MLRRIILGYVLSLLLLFSQQAIAAHEISHLSDPLAHTQDQSPQNNFCEKCLGFSSLHGSLPTFHLALPIATGHDSFIALASIELRNERITAYISRAPPATLV